MNDRYIVAKGLFHTTELLQSGKLMLIKQLLIFPVSSLINDFSSFNQTFLPPYAINFGGWPGYFRLTSKILTWTCAFIWIVPFLRPITRALSLVLLIVHVYLNFGMDAIFPWYFSSVTLLTIIVFSLLIDEGFSAANFFHTKAIRLHTSKLNPLLYSLVAIAIFTIFTLTICTAYQLRIFQTVIYEGNYKQVGLWLHEHASSPQDLVFLEPLGYIGFFSHLKMYDYPGLSSPEVVSARQRFPGSELGDRKIFADLIDYLKPEWLVLRPHEIDKALKKNATLLSQTYLPVKIFDVSDQITSYSFLPGRGWFQLDQSFVVFRRRDG